MSHILDMHGKVALVTGAGQGVGEQIARDFAALGATVIVNDYFAERADAVATAITEAGGQAFAVQADVTDANAVREMFAAARRLAGPVDILVNNAGNYGAAPSGDIRKPFWEHTRDAWNSTIEVNLYGVIHCASAGIPDMIERKGGRIITIISDAGRVGEPGMEVYSGAKAGAAGFTRAVARTLGRHQITANCIAISATATPFTEKALNADPERLKKMMERYVIRRPGQPSDVSNMVMFLASDASSWITGQTYPVNGGFSFSM